MEQTAGDGISRASGRQAASKGSYSRQLPEKTWRYTLRKLSPASAPPIPHRRAARGRGGGSGRPPTDAIGVYRRLPGIEMTPALAFGKPQTVQKDAHTGERFRLARLHLRTRPIDAIDLGFGRGQRTEILVFGGVREFLVQTVLLHVFADLVIPGARLINCENVRDNARAAVFDFRNRFRRDRSALDVRIRNDWNHRPASVAFLDDLRNLAMQLGFDIAEDFGIFGSACRRFLFTSRIASGRFSTSNGIPSSPVRTHRVDSKYIALACPARQIQICRNLILRPPAAARTSQPPNCLR